ncbi:MAG: hypothetical protein KAJ19_22315 [Gammaproteobacteria bacterium]|nr:hypothetical protein [Gammaproteobacteria bacterium]
MGFKHTKRPVNAQTGAADGVPDLNLGRMRFASIDQTAASTALEPGFFYGLTSTNTDTTPKVWSVEEPQAGDLLGVFVKAVDGTCSPMHVRLENAVLVTGGVDQVTLSTAPSGALLIALSSTLWGVLGASGGATFAAST